MAEEKELELEDVSLEDKGSGDGSRKTLILMGAGALVLILLSVGLTLFLLRDDSGDEAEAEAEGAAATPALTKLEYVNLKPFTVNFQHGGRTRLLQVQLSLATRSEAVVDALKLHEPLVNHTVISLLGGRDFDSLRTTEGKEALRQSLLEAVQDVVQQETGDGSVETVLFTRFVMQ